MNKLIEEYETSLNSYYSLILVELVFKIRFILLIFDLIEFTPL